MSTTAIPNGSVALGEILEAGNAAQLPVRKSDAREISDYIVKEMLANTTSQNSDFARVKGLLDEFKSMSGPPASRVTALVRALYEFGKLVNYQMKWDHKDLILRTWGKVSLLSGFEVDWDAWSNVHYGFVGRQIGFNPEVLLAAAGYAQAVGGEIPRGWFERWVSGQAPYFGQALDDPVDQAAISLGMQLSDTRGRNARSVDLMALLRKHLPEISRK